MPQLFPSVIKLFVIIVLALEQVIIVSEATIEARAGASFVLCRRGAFTRCIILRMLLSVRYGTLEDDVEESNCAADEYQANSAQNEGHDPPRELTLHQVQELDWQPQRYDQHVGHNEWKVVVLENFREHF